MLSPVNTIHYNKDYNLRNWLCCHKWPVNAIHYNKDYNIILSAVSSKLPVNTIHYNKDYNTLLIRLQLEAPVNAIHYNKEVQPTLDIHPDIEGGFVYVRAIFFTVDHTLFNESIFYDYK